MTICFQWPERWQGRITSYNVCYTKLLRLALRVGLFGGEPWSEEMRRELEKRLGIVATDNYGLSEVMGPGVAGECLCRCGMHIFEVV